LVNLISRSTANFQRSTLLKGNQARLFARAGIVAGSDPQQELNEAQMKLQALLQALV
jgi:menaquinone-specific isochorismate synthase